MKVISDIDLSGNTIHSGLISTRGLRDKNKTVDVVKGPLKFPKFGIRLLGDTTSTYGSQVTNIRIRVYCETYTEGLENKFYVGLCFKYRNSHGYGYHLTDYGINAIGPYKLNFNGEYFADYSLPIPSFYDIVQRKSNTVGLKPLTDRSVQDINFDHSRGYDGWKTKHGSKVYLSGDLNRFVYSLPVKIRLFFDSNMEFVQDSELYRLIYSGYTDQVTIDQQLHYIPNTGSKYLMRYFTNTGGLRRSQM